MFIGTHRWPAACWAFLKRPVVTVWWLGMVPSHAMLSCLAIPLPMPAPAVVLDGLTHEFSLGPRIPSRAQERGPLMYMITAFPYTVRLRPAPSAHLARSLPTGLLQQKCNSLGCFEAVDPRFTIAPPREGAGTATVGPTLRRVLLGEDAAAGRVPRIPRALPALRSTFHRRRGLVYTDTPCAPPFFAQPPESLCSPPPR